MEHNIFMGPSELFKLLRNLFQNGFKLKRSVAFEKLRKDTKRLEVKLKHVNDGFYHLGLR